jgi:O-Antigen ligase
VSRLHVVSSASERSALRDGLRRVGTSHWLSLVRDEGSSPFVLAGFALLSIAAAILAAWVLGDDFGAFVFVCAAIGATIGVFRPYVAVLGAIIVSPTFGWAVFGPDVSAFQLLVAGAATGSARELLADFALLRRFITRAEVVVGALFVLWLCVAAAARRDVADWGFVRNYLGALLFLGVLALTLRTTRRRATAVGALLVGTLATAVVGLAQIVTTDALVSGWVLPDVGLVQDTYTRLGSAWGLASVGSDYGKDVLVGFMLAVPLMLNGLRRSLRLSLTAAVAILFVGLLMSGGRSAWLGAVIGLGYITLVNRRWRVASAAAVLAVGLTLLIVFPKTPVEIQTAVGLAPRDTRAGPPVERRGKPGSPSPRLVVGGVRDSASTEMSSDLRRRLASAAFGMVRDEPFLGVGAGAFKHYVDRYEPLPPEPDRPIDARPNLPAHNVVLEIWADSGTPAVLLYLTFLGLIVVRLDRHRREDVGFLSALAVGLSATLIALFVTSLFHNYQYDNLLWIICGVAVSLAVFPPGGQRSAERLS